MPAGRAIVCLSVAFIAVGLLLPVRPPAAWAWALALASAALVAPPRTRLAAIVAALSAAAAAHGAAARERALAPSLVLWHAARSPTDTGASPVVVEGTIRGDAEPSDDGARVMVSVHRLTEAGAVHDVRGTIQMHVGGAFAAARIADWVDGRALVATVSLREPTMFRNPGASSPLLQALRRSFDLSGTVKSATLVTVTRGHWWTEAAAATRAWVRQAIARHVTRGGPQAAAIVTAILIGDRRGFDPEVERRLQVAGTYHVVAISGGNVALVLAITVGSLRLLWRSARGTSTVAMGVVLAYGWIAGGDASVTRAVAAACVYLALGSAGQTASAVDVIGVVAAGMAVCDPRTVVDVGAWLSFGASLGIVLFAERLIARVRRTAGWGGGWIHRAAVAGAGLAAATAAAEWSLLPVSARVFGRVGLAGLGLNFLAIPAMAVAQFAGLATCVLAAVSIRAADVAGAIAGAGAEVLIRSSELVDLAPWATWRVPPGWIGWTVLFYASLIVLLKGAPRPWRRRALVGAMLLATGFIVTAPESTLTRAGPPWLRVTVIDVGQGDALLVQFPTGDALAIDAGGVPGAFDMGDRVVLPAVWALGARTLTWSAVTHDDLDHIGGAPSLVTTLRPREVWEGVPVSVNAEWRRWRAAARAVGASWRPLQRGDRLEVGDVTVDVRNPPPPEWERRRVRNDDSLVLLLRYKDVDVLLTGDVGSPVEPELLAGVTPAPLRVLKVAHHGSRSSTSDMFVSAFAPQLAVVSAGRGNVFGHPAPEVTRRLAAAGARLYRTDVDGAITIETDGSVVRVRTWTGQRWEVRVTQVPP